MGVVCVAVDCRCSSSFACVAISRVLDVFRVPLALTPCIILSNPSFAILYPSSRPKSIPFSIPSFIPNFFPFFIPNFSPSSIARSQSNLRFAPSLVVEAQVQNWAMLLYSAISRKLRKSSIGCVGRVFNSESVVVVVFFFEDFFMFPGPGMGWSS